LRPDGRCGIASATAPGDRTFRCPGCRRSCNERTGTPFDHLQAPTDIVPLVVRWRSRDTLRMRDLTALFLARGFDCTPETVRDREARCAPLLTGRWRATRRGATGTRWHADETDVKVNGTWRALYRALDRDGNRVDARLSQTRDREAAQRFFAQALDRVGSAPAQVTTDGHDASPRAIRETPGPTVQHRTSRDTNTTIAPDHRGVQPRDYPVRGFGRFTSAARFCSGFEEQRQYFRSRTSTGERVSLTEQRHLFRERWAAALAAVTAA